MPSVDCAARAESRREGVDAEGSDFAGHACFPLPRGVAAGAGLKCFRSSSSASLTPIPCRRHPGSIPGEWDDQPPARLARICKKMCANDFSPCDPIYFKTEDGRCDGLDFGR